MRIVLIEPMELGHGELGGKYRYVTNLISKLRQKGIETTLIGTKVSGYRFITYLFLKSLFLKLSDKDIVHAQRADQMLPFILFHRKNKKMCSLHGIDYEAVYFKKGKFIGWIYRIIERFVLKYVDRTIAVNKDTKNFYLKKYPWLKDKIVVIPVGINTEQFKPMDKNQMRKKYGFDNKDKIIMFVGRLEREKNLEFLLRAFKNVSKSVENARLVLVGDGGEKKNLEKLAKQLELDNVTFMGTVSHNKIPEVLSCADVFALCSWYEAGPIVIEEAIACGVPVVSADVGRVKEFIVNEFVGRIVEKDENEFVKAISEVLNIEPERVKEECRKVSANFSFDRTAEQTIKVYKDLLGDIE